jgi:hypothetical protein
MLLDAMTQVPGVSRSASIFFHIGSKSKGDQVLTPSHDRISSMKTWPVGQHRTSRLSSKKVGLCTSTH